MSSRQLTPNQKQVLRDLYDWYRVPRGGYITVGGYAGTGKTTMVACYRHLLNKAKPKLKIAFASFTGKASQVLQNKLKQSNNLYPGDTVSTIHSLIYYPRVDAQGNIKGWSRNTKLDYDLIIIDEASMVTADIWSDLLSYQIPIIAVGDHGQLPPVGDNFNLMEKPELLLQEIHRQAKTSPIIEVATLARTHGEIPDRDFSNQVRRLSAQDPDANEIIQGLAISDSDHMILCARNKTRIQLNQHLRQLKGFQSAEPENGDAVICLKNNYQNPDGPIYNGMIGYIKSIKPFREHWYETEVDFPVEFRKFSGQISRHQFNEPTLLSQVKGISPKSIGERFDFGYALTVHKAQGSQADKVVLFEENASKYMGDTYPKWLYTAVTRAVDSLYILY